MKYQKFMKKIMEQLTGYKGVIDSLSSSYLEERVKHEKELEGMRGKYTESYIEESRRNWKPSKDYGKLIAAEREKYQKNAVAYLDKIKTEMDAYFQIPVDSGFAATVTAVKSLGVTLNNKELEVLQNASGGYWGLRLLRELGVSRSKPEQRAVLENGEPKAVKGEKGIPFFGVELPDIEKAYDSLQSVKNAVNMAFEAYCGDNCELKDIVFPLSKYTEETNARIAAEYGTEPPKQTRDAMTISRMSSAKRFFDENHTSYTGFSEMMDSLAATMPKPKRKESLTDSDRKLIDTLIDSKYESLGREQAIQIAKADEHLAEILRLDERYGAAVRKELGEVSENE